MKGLVKRWVGTRAGFKPRDVEEPIDYYWHRPLAGLLVEVIAKWPITPNQVTVLSGVFSFLAGLAIIAGAFYQPWFATVGGFLLLISIVLDCADGQLARVKKISSMIGRALDGCMDIVAPFSVLWAMLFYGLQHGYTHSFVWPVGIAAALSLTWHAAQYDVMKNIYLHCTRPDFSLGGATLITPESMIAYKQELLDQGDRASATVMTVWIFWTKAQAPKFVPWMEPARSPQTESERAIFIELFRPLMAAMTWLGFGTHLFMLTVAAWVLPLDARAIGVVWIFMVVPMNVVCAWVSWAFPRRVEAFETRLAAARAEQSDQDV